MKFYTVEKEINGKTYKAQFNGISDALRAVDNSYIEGTNISSTEKLAKHLFSNVLVEPKMSIDDFGADKIGEVKEKEINGKTYKAQFKGIRFAVKTVDNSYLENGNTSIEKMAKALLDTIIVEPENLDIDDFETMEEFNEVVAFAREVMQGDGVMDEFNEVVAFLSEVMNGNFRGEEKNKKTTKKESSK